MMPLPICAMLILSIGGCNSAKPTIKHGDNKFDSPPAYKSSFDGEKAYALLKKQVEFGYRVPGLKAHDQTLELIQKELKPYVARMELQTFTHEKDSSIVSMVNLIAYTDPKAATQILLCAHWDTRPMADNDVDQSKHNTPIPGANDGASGVAVLLELARVLKTNPVKTGVIFVFFDGEDYGLWPTHMLLGSKYFAKHLSNPKPTRGILLDMIGDKQLNLTYDSYSSLSSPTMMADLYRIGNQLGYKEAFSRNGLHSQVGDDHVPLIEAGVPMVDLIDFDYPYWHTTEDTPDKCSAESLKTIGSVLDVYLHEQK